jgi:hypothetical protein
MGSEIPWDGVDQDGDGRDLDDVDGDGVIGVLAGGEDCNDLDPSVAPGRIDRPGDGIDADCDGWDGTGVASTEASLGAPVVALALAPVAALVIAVLAMAAARARSSRARSWSRSAPPP